MKKEFVPYEQALALKELGFKNNYNFKEYDTDGYLQHTGLLESHKLESINAPLWQQAFRFFDDNTDYKGFIVPSIKEECFDWEIYHGGDKILECNEYYSLRENAELECLKKLIEIAKEQNLK